MEYEELKNRLSYNIKRLRRRYKFSQLDLAEHAGLSKDTIQSIECCRVWPSDKTLLHICTALRSDPYNLFLPATTSIDVRKNLHKDLQTMLADFVKKVVDKSMDEIITDE